MKEDSLFYFSSPSEFKSFAYDLNIYNGWSLQKGLLNDRGRKIRNKVYTNRFIDIFEKKGFFRKKVSLAEIVSWLDNISVILRILERLEKELTIEMYQSIYIVMEYRIKLSKNMRIDFILGYKGRMILLEMRTLCGFEKIRQTWQKKFYELMIYKELLSYYRTEKIIIYSMIILYEYDGKSRVEKHYDYNCNQIIHISRYINEYLLIEKT